jgi:hypothetical protein
VVSVGTAVSHPEVQIDLAGRPYPPGQAGFRDISHDPVLQYKKKAIKCKDKKNSMN